MLGRAHGAMVLDLKVPGIMGGVETVASAFCDLQPSERLSSFCHSAMTRVPPTVKVLIELYMRCRSASSASFLSSTHPAVENAAACRFP